MGLFSSILEPIFGGGEKTATSTSTAAAMARPSEYDQIFKEFMASYLDPDRYKTLYDEKREAEKDYLSKLTGIKEPYLGAVEEAMGTHRGLLDEIVTKRMLGEAVGPYGADIDKLLAERTGVSFGGGDPMQFITGPQQRLLSSLLPAQETGLGGIQQTSAQRAAADILPTEKRYGMERELADIGLGQFMPSNIADIAYLQDLRSMIEPMEFARLGATPSVTAKTTQPGSVLGDLGDITNIVGDVLSMFGSDKKTTPAKT